MKYILPIFVVALFFSGVAIAGPDAPAEISSDELIFMKDEGEDFVIVDSRGGEHFDGEVIEGAEHLSVTETSQENLEKITTSKETKLIFYCSNKACQASSLAGYKAITAGYNNVYKYSEGIDGWRKKGLPTSKL